MEIDQFMTAVEFAEKVNASYPTVAQWLRQGKVPRAFRKKIGNMEIWLIPGDVLKDFERPKMGRPKKAGEKTKTSKAVKTRKSAKK
jgi:hypothetical protein